MLDDDVAQDEPVIGWSGSISHQVDFESDGKGIKNFLRKFPDISYQSMGADYRAWVGRPNSEFRP